MSFLDRLNAAFLSLLSGESCIVNASILKETETAFFRDNALHLRRFLGVLYYYHNDYLLSFALLREELDVISRFIRIADLLSMGYQEEAFTDYTSFNEDPLLCETISANQRVRIAFLLGLNHFSLKEKSGLSPFYSCILGLISNSVDLTDNTVAEQVILKTGDQQLIGELKKRKKGSIEKQPAIIHKHAFDDGFLRVASYSKTIGDNMYLIRIKQTTVIIDCGASAENAIPIDFDNFFKTNGLKPKDVSALFVTHAHLDHVGNTEALLRYLNKESCSPSIYTTLPTTDIANQGNNVRLNCKNNLHIVYYNRCITINDELQAICLPNGHIFGSYAIMFICENKTVFFTSDFCLHDQVSVKGMDLNLVSSYVANRHLDYLITESTYGKKQVSLSYEDSADMLKQLVGILLKNKKSCFFPAYSIGRTQEIIVLVSELNDMDKYGINVLGNASDITTLYKKWGIIPQVQTSSDRNNIRLYGITVASSGTLMEESESHTILCTLLKQNCRDVALIQTGYMPPSGTGASLIKEWKKHKNHFYKIDLSAHASNKELHHLINYFDIGEIISIHGDGIE